jgi:uncharacterized protein
MRKEIRLRRQDFVFALAAVFLLGAILGISLLPNQTQKAQEMGLAEASTEVGIPAVDAEGRGVVGILSTTIKPGTGKILVNVDNVLSQLDTQFSSRTAVKAATDYMKIDSQSIDVIFTLKVNATIVEGPSAGSAMAASVVLALSGIEPDKRIMMTGTIEDDGSIGSVGAITEKAKAAKNAGAEIFLVPEGQSIDTVSRRERKCESYDSVRICNIKYVKENVNVSNSLGIKIIETKTLGDIIKVFKGEV